MTVRLALYNPSEYPRGGMVVTAWAPIARQLGVPRSALVEVTVQGDPEPCDTQVDILDPADPEQDQLVFKLRKNLNPGDPNYAIPTAWATVTTTSVYPGNGGVWADSYPNGVKLGNQRMHIWLNTAVTRHAGEDWYGGAITSVQLRQFEILDAVAADIDQTPHPQIRCAQIDRIHLVRPPWDEDGSIDVFVFNKPWMAFWQTISRGPVRVTVTIESASDRYEFKDVDSTKRVFTCSVFRAISIYADRDDIHEEVWVKAKSEHGDAPLYLWFSPRYFMLMQLTKKRTTFRYPNHDGWFAVNAPKRPHHGFGFATDSHAGPLWNPPLEYTDEHTRHWAYVWELGATRRARSVSLFHRKTTPQELTDAIGWTWYDRLYRPLRAKVL